ncbi:MAG TPA: RIP metalloprotease RseP [Chlamydiales bacterium]|nr:RIP metalloprotease RseP [Chlamydiales bacterium]
MITTIFYFILAILALGILIFIHELGHYLMAKRQKMKVEIFSIGFGKPLYSWKVGEEKWQIAIIPFGGYVKILGMDDADQKHPIQLDPESYFAKSPFSRIKVAFAGPFVNLIFAFLIFIAIWFTGGRLKPYKEYSHLVGEIDNQSELYALGIREGDQILRYNGHVYNEFKDLQKAMVTKQDVHQIQGNMINYYDLKKTAFDFSLNTYEHPKYVQGLKTIGVLEPAQYLIYNKTIQGQPNPILENTPMFNVGLHSGDQIVWVNGEFVFSLKQLSSVINEESVFCTIIRNKKIMHVKAPLVQVRDLRITQTAYDDLDDWKFEKGIKTKVKDLFVFPFILKEGRYIGRSYQFVDERLESEIASYYSDRRQFFTPFKNGDRIIAINGKRVFSSSDILEKLQNKNLLMIVQNDANASKPISWKTIDTAYQESLYSKEVSSIVRSIGTLKQIKSTKHCHLLDPIVPMKGKDFFKLQGSNLAKYKEEIDSIKDPEQKAKAMQYLAKEENRYMLGIGLMDRKVRYNPSPIKLFYDSFKDIYEMLYNLVTGGVSPKYLAGPVGIVQIVKHSWSLGVKEALYWIALISLNLGIINLLPIPPLDGGHILFYGIEIIRKKPMQHKTMEKIILPFVILLILAFIFMTYHDVARIVQRFF